MVIFPHQIAAERIHHYITGFETTNGHRFDLAVPQATEALQPAYELAVLFNPPLEIRRADQIPPFRQRRSRLLVFLLWTALALATRSELASSQLASNVVNSPMSITNSTAGASLT